MSNSPKQMLKLQQFKEGEDGSYVRLARENNVPLVGHVSGTTPGNLAMIMGLSEQNGNNVEKDQLPQLAGLIAASFHRSRFHSPPEVLVGLRHYMDDGKNQDIKSKEEILGLLRDSIELIGNSSSPELKEAVSNLSGDLVSNVNLHINQQHPNVESSDNWGSRLLSLIEENLAKLDNETLNSDKSPVEVATGWLRETDEAGYDDAMLDLVPIEEGVECDDELMELYRELGEEELDEEYTGGEDQIGPVKKIAGDYGQQDKEAITTNGKDAKAPLIDEYKTHIEKSNQNGYELSNTTPDATKHQDNLEQTS